MSDKLSQEFYDALAESNALLMQTADNNKFCDVFRQETKLLEQKIADNPARQWEHLFRVNTSPEHVNETPEPLTDAVPADDDGLILESVTSIVINDRIGIVFSACAAPGTWSITAPPAKASVVGSDGAVNVQAILNAPATAPASAPATDTGPSFPGKWPPPKMKFPGL